MRRFPSPDTITPERFEQLVKSWLEAGAGGLQEFSAKQRQTVRGRDGDYEIDVTATFVGLGGARFTVVVECKKHKNPIKREIVQVLRDKQISIGASKAMLIATASFQSGAIEYASRNGVALIQVVSGQAQYIVASAERGLDAEQPRNQNGVSAAAEDFVGFFYGANPDGQLIFPQLVSDRREYDIELFLHK